MNVKALLPSWLTPPVPEMSWVTVKSSLRLKAKVPVTFTAPVPSEPVVPPLPTCNVPALTLVVV